MARKRFQGRLCVHRQSGLKQLAAKVEFPDGSPTIYYYPVPKCFDVLITDGTKNVAEVEFIAEDGVWVPGGRDFPQYCGHNPRAAKLLGEPYPASDTWKK